MKYLIQNTFSEYISANFKKEFKRFNISVEQVNNLKDEYFLFVDINTLEELNAFVKDCGFEIVYGKKGVANEAEYPVIEIYVDYRE